MVDDSAVWLKLYTSVLDHDGFEGLDDSSRVLIVLLWAYAARSGRHVFPADPAWLRRRIPILNAEPDLGPLLGAKDVYGNPTPFIAYCEPPVPEEAQKPAKKAAAKKPAKKAAKKERQTDREREREKDEILTDFEKERKKEKTRVETRVSTETEQTERQATGWTAAEKPAEPVNPNDSEAGAVEAHIVPKPPQSALRGPQAIGAIIGQRFADHWQDPDAEAFGWQIVEALGLPTDRHNLTARSEWGAFAKWWSDIKKMCPAIALDGLRSKAIRKAEFLNSPKARSARNKSAVWFHIMEGETGHGSGQQARASP